MSFEDFEPIIQLLRQGQVKSTLIPAQAQAIFPGKDPEQVFRRRMTQLMQFWEHFVCYELHQPPTADQQQMLSRFFRQKDASKLSLELLQKQAQEAEKITQPSPQDNLSLYFNYTLQYDLLSTSRRRTDLKIGEAVDRFSQFGIHQSLMWACLALSHTKVTGQKYHMPLIDHMIQHIQSDPSSLSSPEIKAYYLAHQILTSKDSDHSFEELNQLILDEKIKVIQDRKNVLLFAINFCIRKANEGVSEFIQKAFDLYRWGLNNHLLLEDNHISKYTYRNIINHGFGLNELTWVYSFMKEYKKYLPHHDRENTYQYNLARWYFHNKEYDEVLTILRDVDFDDLGYNIDGRRMVAKVYWITNQRQALYSFLDSFKIYLIRHRQQFAHYRAFSTFIKFLKKIISLDVMNSVQKRTLLKKIRSARSFIDQQWMIEVIKESI